MIAKYQMGDHREILDNPELFWGIIDDLESWDFDLETRRTCLRNLLVNGIIHNRNRMETLKSFFQSHRDTQIAREEHIQRMICEFADLNGWQLMAYSDNLLISSKCLENTRFNRMWRNTARNSSLLRWAYVVPIDSEVSFTNLIVHKIRFVGDDLGIIYAFYGLVGMLASGKHMIPATVEFALEFSFEKAFGLANESGNITGITCVENDVDISFVKSDGCLVRGDSHYENESVAKIAYRDGKLPEKLQNSIGLLEIKFGDNSPSIIKMIAPERIILSFDNSSPLDWNRIFSSVGSSIIEEVILESDAKGPQHANLEQLTSYSIQSIVFEDMRTKSAKDFVVNCLPSLNELKSVRIESQNFDLNAATAIKASPIETLILNIDLEGVKEYRDYGNVKEHRDYEDNHGVNSDMASCNAEYTRSSSKLSRSSSEIFRQLIAKKRKDFLGAVLQSDSIKNFVLMTGASGPALGRSLLMIEDLVASNKECARNSSAHNKECTRKVVIVKQAQGEVVEMLI